MNSIKVKFNEPDPDPAIIRKHKDFDRFLDTYTKYYSTGGIRYLLRHDIKKLVFIVIIILLLLILLFTESEAHVFAVIGILGI